MSPSCSGSSRPGIPAERDRQTIQDLHVAIKRRNPLKLAPNLRLMSQGGNNPKKYTKYTVNVFWCILILKGNNIGADDG